MGIKVDLVEFQSSLPPASVGRPSKKEKRAVAA